MNPDQETSLSQLLRTHVAVPGLPSETILNWGVIKGRGNPGALQEGDEISFGVSCPVKTRCYVYKGLGEFVEAPEVDPKWNTKQYERLNGFRKIE
jgi:hypothetical protein